MRRITKPPNGFHDPTLAEFYKINPAKARRAHGIYAAREAGLTYRQYSKAIRAYRQQAVAELLLTGSVTIPTICALELVEVQESKRYVVIAGQVTSPTAKRAMRKTGPYLTIRIRPMWFYLKKRLSHLEVVLNRR